MGMPGRLGAIVLIILLSVVSGLQSAPQIQPAPLPHTKGQGVTPSFEGWYPNPDGTFSLSFGYFNRNHQEEVDIPVGPNNRIEPGTPDQGQPTHFRTRRHTGVFTVVVPADFGKQKVTWTLTVNGETNSVPGHLRPEWEIDALKEVTSGNTPPLVRFDPAGKAAQGPGGATTSMEVVLPQPATVNIWVTDDNVRKREAEGRGSSRPTVGVNWSKYRGPGRVTFSSLAPPLDASGKATTTVSFSEPGEYMLRVLAWDASGGQSAVMAGGFQCCWTNGYVKVNVRSGQTASR